MNPEADRWIQAHLDGTITPMEELSFASWLKEDPEHMRRFTEELLFENELRLAAEAALKPEAVIAFEPPALSPAPRRSWARPRFTLFHAAAAMVLFAGLLAFKFAHTSPPQILTVREISGSLSWSGANGEVRPHLAMNQKLPAGTFEALGENSHVVLAFGDGTEITLRGECRANIAQPETQKQIHLQSGSLRAEVTPQPAGRPMLLRTATANVEVVGTIFSLTADAEKTTMNVERGRVRMKRTVDGSTVEVSANQTAAASLKTTPLRATSNGTAPDRWEWVASTPPPPDTRGAWQPAVNGEPARLSSQPIIVGTDPADNRVLVQHGVAFRENGGNTKGAFVTVGPDSKLRFRYRAANVSTIVVFFTSQLPDGSFGGNFEMKLPPGSGVDVEGGWREMTVPLNEMPALHPSISRQPQGNGILHLSVRSYHETPRLEFSRFSITPH